jgi:tetratricopeptide (TPR) repeat protein
LERVAECLLWVQATTVFLKSNGIDLDTKNYTETGIMLDWLPEAKSRSYPFRYSDQRFTKFKNNDSYIDESYFIGGHRLLMEQAYLDGDWIKAAELSDWTRNYGREIYNNKDKVTKFKYAHSLDAHHYATRKLAEIALLHGYPDKAAEIIGENVYEIVPLWYGEDHRSRQLHLYYLAFCGQANLDDIKWLDEMYPKIRDERFYSVSMAEDFLITKAWVLFFANQKEEALAFAENLYKEKPIDKNRELLLNIYLKLNKSEVEHEKHYIELLENYRGSGRNLDEVLLYFNYAKFLYQIKRVKEAIKIQKEANRLAQSFGLQNRYLHGLALLIKYQFEENLIQLAKKNQFLLSQLCNSVKDIPVTFEEAINSALELELNPGKSVNQLLAQSDLQPKNITTYAILGQSPHARFTIANLIEQPTEGNLTVQTPLSYSVKIVENQEELEIILNRDENMQSITQETYDLTLEAEEILWIKMVAPVSHDVNDGQKTIQLAWNAGSEKISGNNKKTITQTSTWTYDHGPATSITTFTDAVLVSENPFYLIPIIQHIFVPQVNEVQVIDFRFLPSESARIEAYNGITGELVYVDANGDGDLFDSGDALHHDSNKNGFPDILLDGNTEDVYLELYILPNTSVRKENSELTIGAQILNKNEWITQSESIMELSN